MWWRRWIADNIDSKMQDGRGIVRATTITGSRTTKRISQAWNKTLTLNTQSGQICTSPAKD